MVNILVHLSNILVKFVEDLVCVKRGVLFIGNMFESQLINNLLLVSSVPNFRIGSGSDQPKIRTRPDPIRIRKKLSRDPVIRSRRSFFCWIELVVLVTTKKRSPKSDWQIARQSQKTIFPLLINPGYAVSRIDPFGTLYVSVVKQLIKSW